MQNCARYFDRAMSISVSLEANQHTYPRPNQLFDAPRIIPNRAEIYLDPRWPLRTHDYDLLPPRRLTHQLFWCKVRLSHQHLADTFPPRLLRTLNQYYVIPDSWVNSISLLKDRACGACRIFVR